MIEDKINFLLGEADRRKGKKEWSDAERDAWLSLQKFTKKTKEDAAAKKAAQASAKYRNPMHKLQSKMQGEEGGDIALRSQPPDEPKDTIVAYNYLDFNADYAYGIPSKLIKKNHWGKYVTSKVTIKDMWFAPDSEMWFMRPKIIKGTIFDMYIWDNSQRRWFNIDNTLPAFKIYAFNKRKLGYV